jgi:S-(hydroxymethyl)glutathione dehydrogenase/alcohol dehydrogenase
VATVLQLTDGIGVDYSFEAIGNAEAMAEAYTAARQGGICTIVGVAPFTEILELPAGLIAIQEKTLHGTFYGGGAALRDYPRLIDLYKQGRLKLTPLITTTYSIEDSDKAYADMAAGRQAGRGVVLFQN